MQSTEREPDAKTDTTPEQEPVPAPEPAPTVKELFHALNAELARHGVWVAAEAAEKPALGAPLPGNGIACHLKQRTPDGGPDHWLGSRETAQRAIRRIGEKHGVSPDWLTGTSQAGVRAKDSGTRRKSKRTHVYRGSHLNVTVA